MSLKRLIIASNNQGKIKEIKTLLEDMSIEVLSLKDIDLNIDVEEDGETFKENANKKSFEIYKELIKRDESNFIVMSDDSGLEVEYLNYAPGVLSARYAGEHGNDKKNNKKLIEDLKRVPYSQRKARFVCHLSLVDDKGSFKDAVGYVEGNILEEESGEGGFGYDPLFFYEPLNKTFGEMSKEEKNKISHRGNALKKIREIIKGFIEV